MNNFSLPHKRGNWYLCVQNVQSKGQIWKLWRSKIDYSKYCLFIKFWDWEKHFLEYFSTSASHRGFAESTSKFLQSCPEPDTCLAAEQWTLNCIILTIRTVPFNCGSELILKAETGPLISGQQQGSFLEHQCQTTVEVSKCCHRMWELWEHKIFGVHQRVSARISVSQTDTAISGRVQLKVMR